jgi:hypothetical protein
MDSNFSTVTKMCLTRKKKLLSETDILVVFLYFNPSMLRPILARLKHRGAQTIPDHKCACGYFTATVQAPRRVEGIGGGCAARAGHGKANKLEETKLLYAYVDMPLQFVTVHEHKCVTEGSENG